MERIPEEPARGICFDCHYPLRSISSVHCPECGRPFDPTDRSTMNMGKPFGPLAKALMGRMGVPTNLLSIGSMVALFVGGMLIGGPRSFVIAMWIAIVALSYQLLRSLLARVFRRIYHQPVFIQRRGIYVLSILLLYLLGITGITFRAAFELHRPLLDRFARHVHSEMPLLDVRHGSYWVGLFFFDDVHVAPSGVTFTLGRYYDAFYLSYVDSPAAARSRGEELGGGWYFHAPQNWWPLLYSDW